MNIHLNAAVGGRFKFEVYKAETGEKIKEIDWFDNLVLDGGLAAMRTATRGWIMSIQLGTGTSEPHVSQTNLDNVIAFGRCGSWSPNDVTSTSRGSNIDEGYHYVRQTVRFPAGRFNNTHALSEVGIAYASDTPKITDKLWNRALLKDENGNPRTITIESDEYLDLTFEVRCYVDKTDLVSDDFIVKDRYGDIASTHQVTVRTNFQSSPSLGSRIDAFTCACINNANLPALNANATGTTIWSGASGSGVSHGLSYGGTENPTRMTYSVSAPLTVGNTDLKLFKCTTDLGIWYVKVDPPITKTNRHTFQMFFTLNWGRYTPPANNQP